MAAKAENVTARETGNRVRIIISLKLELCN
jgi:hypothetical protein